MILAYNTRAAIFAKSLGKTPLVNVRRASYSYHMQPHQILSSQFYMSPSVYGWRRGTEYLYIGQALSLLKRFGGHHIIGIREDFQKDDKIDVWFFDKHLDASIFESKMIKEHFPKYNTGQKPRYRPYKPRDKPRENKNAFYTDGHGKMKQFTDMELKIIGNLKGSR